MVNKGLPPSSRCIRRFLLPLVLVGMILLGTLAVAINTGLASWDQGPFSALGSIAPTPTHVPTPAPDKAPAMLRWSTYSDDVAGFSFKYPEGWIVSEAEPGKAVRLLNQSSEYYRGIEILIDTSSEPLSIGNYAEDRLREAFGGAGQPRLRFDPFKMANVSGVRVTGFAEGILDIFVVAGRNATLTFSLIQGGEIGGASASDFPTANVDEQTLFQILETLEFSNLH